MLQLVDSRQKRRNLWSCSVLLQILVVDNFCRNYIFNCQPYKNTQIKQPFSTQTWTGWLCLDLHSLLIPDLTEWHMLKKLVQENWTEYNTDLSIQCKFLSNINGQLNCTILVTWISSSFFSMWHPYKTSLPVFLDIRAYLSTYLSIYTYLQWRFSRHNGDGPL